MEELGEISNGNKAIRLGKLLKAVRPPSLRRPLEPPGLGICDDAIAARLMAQQPLLAVPSHLAVAYADDLGGCVCCDVFHCVLSKIPTEPNPVMCKPGWVESRTGVQISLCRLIRQCLLFLKADKSVTRRNAVFVVRAICVPEAQCYVARDGTPNASNIDATKRWQRQSRHRQGASGYPEPTRPASDK